MNYNEMDFNPENFEILKNEVNSLKGSMLEMVASVNFEKIEPLTVDFIMYGALAKLETLLSDKYEDKKEVIRHYQKQLAVLTKTFTKDYDNNKISKKASVQSDKFNLQLSMN